MTRHPTLRRVALLLLWVVAAASLAVMAAVLSSRITIIPS